MGKRICTYEGCGREGKRKGICTPHFERVRKHGRVLDCTVIGCSKPRSYRRYCGDHKHLIGATCEVDGCNRRIFGRGYCNGHWKRWRDHGDPLAGRHITKRRVTTDGYIEIWRPANGSTRGSRILEHRQVMADALGRPLRSQETVHHIDGNRKNNDLTNLELWVSSHPKGQRVTDLVRWAREILEEYGDLG